MVVEALQMISLLMSGNRMPVFNSGYSNVVKSAIRFATFEHLQRELGLDFTGPLVICILVFQLALILVAIYFVVTQGLNKKTKQIFTVMNSKTAELISIYSMAFLPLFSLPFFAANFSVVVCTADSPYL